MTTTAITPPSTDRDEKGAAAPGISLFVLPASSDVESAIVDAAISRLRAWLDSARPGLCARLDDLPAPLMASVAEQLYGEYASDRVRPRANVRVLVDGTPVAPWQCQWTEAVRLRNQDEQGQKRPPLLLLVPPGTALLGSLDADTFTVVSCETIVQEIVAARASALPGALAPVRALLREHAHSDLQRAHYLLTLEANGFTAEAAGLALCLLGLWPQPDWLTSGDQREYWLTRNKEVVSLLRSGNTSLLNRVYDLDLTSAQQAARLYDVLSNEGSVEAAATRVATSGALHDLVFPWDFASKPDTVVITLDPLGLPKREDGYHVLRLHEQPQLALSWSTAPAPAHVPELTHYLVELVPSSAEIAVDGELAVPASAYRSEAVSPGKSARKTYRIKDLKKEVDAGDLPEGLYRARVTAWAHATNITGQPPSDESTATETNLSDYFWLVLDPNAVTDDLTPAPKERVVASFAEARREVQWSLLDRKSDPWKLPDATYSWDKASNGRAAHGTCTIQFGRHSFRLRLSNLLRRMEEHILTRPEELGALSTTLTQSTGPRDLTLTTRPELPRLAVDDPFLVARTALFAKLRGDDSRGLVETADLLALKGEITTYVREYIRLLRDAERDVAANPKRWPERVGLAAMDTVRLRLPGLSDQSPVAILLAPTHPLRLLWSLQLALMSESWLSEAWQRGTPDALSTDMRQALQGGLQPIHFPPVLFDRRRVGYLQIGPVMPGWDVYLPADVPDRQSALARLARVLGGTVRPTSGPARAATIADRVVRYLRQHPYTSELLINVFNPADGKLIEELLERLDAVENGRFRHLRYDVRLFAPDAVRDDLGAALDQLVNPEITVTTGETAEKYSQGGRFPLHANLRYSKNQIADFLAQPHRFQAHVSLLLDVFRPQIDVAEAFPAAGGPGLYGLVQEETVRTSGALAGGAVAVGYAWQRQVVPGTASELQPDATEAALLGEALAVTQGFLAALGASPGRSGRLPTTGLNLSIEGQNLLYEIHRVSDWVLTVDRHLGIDYFDSSVRTSEPAGDVAPMILLDIAPDYPISDDAVLMLTAQTGTEVERLVAPALERLGLERPGAGRQVVEWLRSVSGRLAMRLLAAPVAAQGVVGMALARAFLEHLGALADALVIPVDAHTALLRTGSAADDPGTRTDLLLMRRASAARQVEFTLAEVKCTAGLLPPAAFTQLRGEIEEQVAQTHKCLAALFDPLQQNPDHIDRPLRSLTLSRLLRFYIGRARRFGLLSEEAGRSLEELLSDIASGYTVTFRTLGVVFELGRDDDVEDAGGDVIIHRVGRRSCERLLAGKEEAAPAPPSWDRVRTQLRGGTEWSRTDTTITGAALVSTQVEALDALASLRETVRPPASPPSSGSVEAPPGALATNQPAASTDVAEEAAVVTSGDEAEGAQSCSYLIGDTRLTPQWGVLGKLGNDVVGLDLNGCNTLSIFGVQGGGKSYTMGSILEMAIRPLRGLNRLPHPLAGVVFHYNESQNYPPEFVSMAQPNHVAAEIARLREEYRGDPAALEDLLVLAPEDKVAQRKGEFPGIAVQPIAFHPAELTIQDWRFLMGAVGNDSLYIRELNLIMRTIRDNITVEGLRQAVEQSQLSDSQKKLAGLRLRFAEQFVRDGDRLRDKLYPGRLVIVDLRDELIETDEALGLFVVMLRIFAGSTHEGRPFNKWIAFDEAHKYIRNPDLVDSVVEVIRQMRHQATSVLIASQDPPSLPLKVMELSSIVMLHRMDSPGWLKHIQRAITALGDLVAPALARLRPGEAYLWARSATDPLFTHRAVKIQCRPRATQHGGATKTAFSDQ